MIEEYFWVEGARTRDGMVPPTNDEILAYFEVVTDRKIKKPTYVLTLLYLTYLASYIYSLL